MVEGPVLPPGTRPGTAAVPRGGAEAALVGAGPLALAVTSLLFGRELLGFGRTGEAVRELGVGVLDWGVAVTAAFVAVRTRLAASRRSREAGEPGRRCARRERWLEPVGGRASLGLVDLTNAVIERGTEAVVGVEGLEGLGHLEDGSGQTGLLGWEEGPRGDGLSFSLEAGLGSAGAGDGADDGADDGVRALRLTSTP